MTTPEGKLKAELKWLLQMRNGFYSMVSGGAYGKNGDPDMVICYRGRYIAVEAKTEDGRQSKWQRVREGQIKNAGGIYVLARKREDLEEVLDEIDDEIAESRARAQEDAGVRGQSGCDDDAESDGPRPETVLAGVLGHDRVQRGEDSPLP